MKRYRVVTRLLLTIYLVPVLMTGLLIGYVVGETAAEKGVWKECFTVNDNRLAKRPYKVCL